MKASVIALGVLAVALTHCSGDRGVFVGSERDGGGGEGDTGGTAGTGGDPTGGTSSGSGGDANTGGSSSGQGGGTGAQGPGGTGAASGTSGASSGGGGGTDTGGLGGDVSFGGSGALGGSGADAGSGGDVARGGTATGGQAGTNNGGSGGGSVVDCVALAREYLDRLAAAQECTPMTMPTTANQCSLEMPDDLICGCPTYVNPTRESDIRRMNEIIASAGGCSRVCPAIACPGVTKGVCSGDTSVTPARGRCRGAP